MSMKLSHCFVTVHDQEEALVFYRDILGLEVRSDMAIGPMRWLTVGCATRSMTSWTRPSGAQSSGV